MCSIQSMLIDVCRSRSVDGNVQLEATIYGILSWNKYRHYDETHSIVSASMILVYLYDVIDGDDRNRNEKQVNVGIIDCIIDVIVSFLVF